MVKQYLNNLYQQASQQAAIAAMTTGGSWGDKGDNKAITNYQLPITHYQFSDAGGIYRDRVV
jgi:hypothetical protein